MPAPKGGPRVPFRLAAERRIDDVIFRIRGKFEIKTFADVLGQSKECAKYFEHFDASGLNSDTSLKDAKTQRLSFDQYWDAMTAINFVGIKQDVEAFFYFWDCNLQGFFDYRRISDIMYGLDPEADEYPLLKPDAKAACEKFRVAVIARYGAAAMDLLAATVRPMLDTSGCAPRAELERCLETFAAIEAPPEIDVLANGPPPSKDMYPADLQLMLTELDPSRSGRVRYSRLAYALLCHALPYDRKLMVRDIFQRFDSTGTGVVARREMARAADWSCHPAVTAGIISLMQAEDAFAALPRQLSLADLLAHYRGVSVALESDTDFEMMLRNTWAAVQTRVSNPTLRRVLVTHTGGEQEIVDIVDDIGDGSRFDLSSARDKVRSRGVNNIAKVEL